LSATTGASVTANPTATTTYSVTGTDASGCVGTDQVIVTVNPLPTINGGVDQTVCAGQTVTLTATGGATYTWAPVVTNGTAFTPAATGTYTVTGTDANGCINTDQVLVTVNPLPVVVVADVTICATATATLTATGATTYSWSPATNLSAATGATVTFTPGTTTTYTITGTTAGCISTDQATVTVLPNAPINGGADAAICTGASTTLTATGGATYTWSPATGLSATSGASVTANPTTTTTYSVTGTDASGCVGTDQVLVTVNPLPTINGGADQTVCAGQTVTLTATGGATYTWAPVVTNGTAFTPAATGTYTVTGTDANGCINTDQVLVTVNPLPTIVVADVTICATATATLTASGATTYTWSPATNLSAATGATVTFTPGITTTYTISGTDANGCVSTDQAIVSVLANAPINAGADVAICSGASTTLTATGGVTYTWSPATGLSATIGAIVTANPTTTTTYSVTGTDASGCVGTDQVIVTVNPLPTIDGGADQTVCAGQTVTLTATGGATYTWAPVVTNGTAFTPAIGSTTYTVTGTSAGCTSTDQVVVNVNPLPTIGAGVDVAICINGSTTLTATGGSTYTWSPATGLSATTGIIVTANPTATSSYTVTGTDANGCISTDQVIVSVNPLPTVNAGLDVAVCAGQTVTLNGTGAITYSWTAPVVNGLAFAPAATTTYTLTGTSALGCVNTDQILVTVNPLPTVIGGPDQTVCIGAQVTLIGQGATTYSWSPLVTNGTAFIPVLGATTYTVTGTTAAGCTSTDQLVVTATSLPTINAGTDVSVCDGSQVTLTANGGTSYTWAPAITNGTPFVPTIGSTTYSVTGTDANGCIASDQVVVLVNQLPTVVAGNDIVICDGVPITLTGSGAATYTWSPVVVNNVPFVPAAGTTIYTVTGTSVAGCTGSDQLTVSVNSNLLADFIPVVTVGCTPLSVTFTNNTLNSVNCVWNMGDGTTLTGCSTVTNTYEQPGCYDVTLTVTAQNGCVSNLTVLDAVCVEGFPNAEFSPSTNTINEYNMEVSFNNNSTGASNYVWDFGDGSPNSTDVDPIHDYTNSPYGNYEVMLVAISPAGCADTAYSVIQIIEELIYYVPNTFTPDGDTYNQTFKPVFTSGFDIYDYSLFIYDRWGEVIFESHDANYGWDGAYGTDEKRDVQDGTYTWVIEFKVSMNDERKRVNGHVNVLR
jgi:gliding motility-associated-like protein